MKPGYVMLPLNCPSDWGFREECPKCRQFHLRLGYCQAVDSVVDKPPSVDISTLSSVDKRKAYQKEWSRKKRAISS